MGTTLSWDSGFCSSFLSFRTSIFNLYKMAEFTAEQIEVPAEPAADTGFSADQLEDFKEAFGLFDRVGDNQVAFNQVADICRALGQNPTNKEVAAILGNPTADDMANKRINFDAFLPMLKTVDGAPNGTVMGAELRIVLSTLGEKMNEKEIDELMAGQEDENGSVHYEAFVKHIMPV